MKRTMHIYPTLRCNGHCPYCSNICPTAKGGYCFGEAPPSQWINLMRDHEGYDFYFTGGEVFLTQGFPDVLRGIPKFARIYTNAMLITEGMLSGIDPKKVLFRCSFHPGIGSVDKFLGSLALLKEKKLPHQVYMVNTLENEAPRYKTDVLEKGYDIGIDYDQRVHTHKVGKVRCQSSTLIVGPDGSIFPCVSRMVRGISPGVNVFDVKEIPDPQPMVCNEPNACTPCDLAAASQEVMV